MSRIDFPKLCKFHFWTKSKHYKGIRGRNVNTLHTNELIYANVSNILSSIQNCETRTLLKKLWASFKVHYVFHNLIFKVDLWCWKLSWGKIFSAFSRNGSNPWAFFLVGAWPGAPVVLEHQSLCIWWNTFKMIFPSDKLSGIYQILPSFQLPIKN